jgi:16S rRNA (guanine1207-N2)-methyltransferase
VLVLRAATNYPFEWFLRGEPSKDSNLVLHQTLKSECLNLQAKGFQVAADPATECDGVLFFPTRQKQESLYWLGVGIESIRASGGYLIGACENNLGAKSYLRALHEAGVEPECGSKARSIAFCAKIDKQNLDYGQVREWLKYGELRPIADSPYLTRAGIFSVDELDAGSTLLLQNLPRELNGNGADFGAGNGYLGLEILRQRPEISSVSLSRK